MRPDAARRGWVRTAWATAAFALVHSATASTAAKDAVERRIGTRRRDAFYRPAYNVLAVVTSTALLAYVRRQPNHTIYQARGTLAVVMRFAQGAALAYATWAAWWVGPLRFSGTPSMVAWALGAERVPREPEGQSPPVGDGLNPPTGPFRLSRHPLNFVLLPLLWLNPRMTSNLAAFAAVTALYAYLGSLHTDRRMRRRYGAAFDRYRETTPLLLPRIRRAAGGPGRHSRAPELTRYNRVIQRGLAGASRAGRNV